MYIQKYRETIQANTDIELLDFFISIIKNNIFKKIFMV